MNSKEIAPITAKEIADAEEQLGGIIFDCARRAVIQELSSRDVEACPGSGKTTTLVAKLYILGKRQQSGTYQGGICVLSHTNVAADEIRNKLGEVGASLFRYPNFCGTIQAFVNQFLARPGYKLHYSKELISIGEDYQRIFKKNLAQKLNKNIDNLEFNNIYTNIYTKYRLKYKKENDFELNVSNVFKKRRGK